MCCSPKNINKPFVTLKDNSKKKKVKRVSSYKEHVLPGLLQAYHS